MGKRVVTFEELVDLAIGTPESAVNFLILQKVLKLLSRYCCKMDYKFEIDMDNMRADITAIGNPSRSSFSDSQGSYESNADSGHTETNMGNVEEIDGQSDKKREKDHDGYEDREERSQVKTESDRAGEEKEERSHVKTESDNQEHSTDQKKSEGGSVKVDEKYDVVKEKKEKKKRTDSDSHRKKSSEKHKRRSSENVRNKDSGSQKRRDSDNTKNRMHALEDFTKKSDNRTSELENHFKELADRIESITETIATHLGEKHLAEINEEIDILKKSMENTTDQCFEVTSTINDQSSQIQDILATINNIQLRKVENDELIDLLSGKADYSFVNEKVSTSQFEEIIQELKDVMNEGTTQLDSVRVETSNSLDEIKQELLTKLLAEEFDEAKTKIYKELIKLTEQHELILAQQNEHVAAGAKMRNLNCFVCNNDVVMLLEQETIPKFRGLKSSLQPLEPVVGSKILIGKNAPEWKSHQLQAKDYTKTSKASRFQSNVTYEKETYVKGKNGCMYKGKVSCDCCEGMDAIAKTKRATCCGMVEANNRKNISQTNKMNSNSKMIGNTGVGDVPQIISSDHQEDKTYLMEDNVDSSTKIAIKVEEPLEAPNEDQTPNSIVDPKPNNPEAGNEVNITATNTATKVETNATPANNGNSDSKNSIDGNLIMTETNEVIPIETNNATEDVGVEVENQ